MSHELSVVDGRVEMAYTGETPWHGLGAELKPGLPVEEWAKAIGLEWEVEEAALTRAATQNTLVYQGTPNMLVQGFKALVRSDTQDVLHVVSDRYKVVQPVELLDFFHELQADAGIEMETLGVLKQGRVIWGLANTGEEITLRGNDRIKEYLLLSTSYNLQTPTICQRTSVRVVCNNTLAWSLQRGASSGIRLATRHTAEFDFAEAKALIINAAQDKASFNEDFAKEARAMSERIVKREEVVRFFTDLLWPKADPEELKKSKLIQTRLGKVIDIYQRAPGQEMDSAKNTAWGLVNGATYLVDHLQGRTDDSRVFQAFFGDGARLKKQAWQAAMKLAA